MSGKPQSLLVSHPGDLLRDCLYATSVPYVVGVNPNSPSNPHSAMASGGTDINAIDTDPVNTTYVIYGAVIGGPDANDNFFDIRSDWPETEVIRIGNFYLRSVNCTS
jgi:hypothetical protein